MNRLISGNVLLDVGPVDLGAVLHTTLQGLQPAADIKGVQLTMSVPDRLRKLNGDSRRLQQVLWNLVHNAVKFTPSGGRVEARLHEGGGALVISVQDTGRGISPGFLPHIFERFRQEDSSSREATAGLGLGLAIARQLVELHGGTIDARSAGPGTGATLVVRLPIGAPAGDLHAASAPGGTSFPRNRN
jgi:signal transduction histidine kinase